MLKNFVKPEDYNHLVKTLYKIADGTISDYTRMIIIHGPAASGKTTLCQLIEKFMNNDEPHRINTCTKDCFLNEIEKYPSTFSSLIGATQEKRTIIIRDDIFSEDDISKISSKMLTFGTNKVAIVTNYEPISPNITDPSRPPISISVALQPDVFASRYNQRDIIQACLKELF